MFKALKAKTKDESLKLLSDLIALELPSPLENKLVSPELLALKQSIVTEVVSGLRGKLSETEQRHRYFDALSESISQLTTQSRDNSRLRQEIGQKAILSTALYRPVYKEDFSTSIARFGVRKTHVEDALSRPDIVEDFKIGNEVSYSLFLKNITLNNDVSQLMIIVQRQNDAIIVHNAWRFFSHEIAVSGMDVLKRFVEQYGFEVEFNGERRKLFYDYRVTYPDVSNVKLDFKVVNKGSKEFTSTITYKTDLLENSITIAYLFSIDNRRYLEDLEKFLKRDVTGT